MNCCEFFRWCCPFTIFNKHEEVSSLQTKKTEESAKERFCNKYELHVVEGWRIKKVPCTPPEESPVLPNTLRNRVSGNLKEEYPDRRSRKVSYHVDPSNGWRKKDPGIKVQEFRLDGVGESHASKQSQLHRVIIRYLSPQGGYQEFKVKKTSLEKYWFS